MYLGVSDIDIRAFARREERLFLILASGERMGKRFAVQRKKDLSFVA